MTLKPDCKDLAYDFMTTHSVAKELTHRLALGWSFPINIPSAMYEIDYIERLITSIRRDEKISSEQYTILRNALADVKGHLPAVEVLEIGESGRLSQSINDADKFRERLEDVMFQAVVECECSTRK